MGRQKIAGLVILFIFLFSIPIVNADDDDDVVELPFDFFHGRWVEGNSFGGFLERQSGETHDGAYGYQYNLDNFNFSFERTYQHGDQTSQHGWETVPKISMAWRGLSNSQFSGQYGHRDFENSYINNEEDNYGFLNFIWQNSPVVKISNRNSAYSYQYDQIPQKNYFSSNLMFSIDQYFDLRVNQSSNDSLLAINIYLLDEFTNTSLEVNWTPLLDIFTNISFSFNRAKWEQSYKRFFPGLFHRKVLTFRNKSISYNWKTTFARFAPLYVRLSFGQRFYKGDDELYLSVTDNSGIISSESEKHETGFIQSDRSFNLSARYITNGSFDPNIMLDDYQNYYHGMLFSGQFKAELNFHYDKHLEITAKSFNNHIAVGIKNHFQISSDLTYHEYSEDFLYYRNYQNIGYTLFEKSWSSILSLQYRSFTYEDGNGPGWDRDNKYDIQFGHVLQPGHIVAGVTAEKPIDKKEGGGWTTFNGNTQISEFEYFDQFDIRFMVSAGIGFETEIGVERHKFYREQESDKRIISISLRSRFIPKTNLALEFTINSYENKYRLFPGYDRSYYLQVKREGWYSEPNIVTVSFSLLI